MTKEKYLKIRGKKFPMLEEYLRIRKEDVDLQLKGALYKYCSANQLIKFLDNHFQVSILVNKDKNKVLKVF